MDDDKLEWVSQLALKIAPALTLANVSITLLATMLPRLVDAGLVKPEELLLIKLALDHPHHGMDPAGVEMIRTAAAQFDAVIARSPPTSH